MDLSRFKKGPWRQAFRIAAAVLRAGARFSRNKAERFERRAMKERECSLRAGWLEAAALSRRFEWQATSDAEMLEKQAKEAKR